MNVKQFTPFEEKIWLCSPTMHKEELEFVTHDAFEAKITAILDVIFVVAFATLLLIPIPMV